MRYETKISNGKKIITIKVSKQALGGEFSLNEFLKRVRAVYNSTIQDVHKATGASVEDCQAIEEGKKKPTKIYLSWYAEYFKLPMKLAQLGIIQADETTNMFSERLKELRQLSDKSQFIVALELGIARSTYACYETGKNVPDIHTLIKIADYYNITLDYLVGRSDEP